MPTDRILRTLALAVLLALPAAVSAADADGERMSASAEIDALRARLAERHPGFSVDAIRTTPVDGIYEVVSGSDVMYMTPDARYLFRGELIDLEERRDLTAERRQEVVHRRVNRLGADGMIVYEPRQGPARHTITVFTDTTCPYCRRLHRDLMDMIEQYPIRVRYLMFPREGLQSAGADELRDVWCADDPRAALTRAKSDDKVARRDDDCETPIREHFETGREIGIDGTPYVLIEDGPVFAGYRPYHELLALMGIESAGSDRSTPGAQ